MPNKTRKKRNQRIVGGRFRFKKIFGPKLKGVEQEFKSNNDQRKAFVQTLKKKYDELEKANANISIEVLVVNAKKKNKEESELLNKQLKELPEKLKNEIDNIYIEEEKRDLELKQLEADIKANTSFWN
jgi:hypothetical protein